MCAFCTFCGQTADTAGPEAVENQRFSAFPCPYFLLTICSLFVDKLRTPQTRKPLKIHYVPAFRRPHPFADSFHASFTLRFRNALQNFCRPAVIGLSVNPPPPKNPALIYKAIPPGFLPLMINHSPPGGWFKLSSRQEKAQENQPLPGFCPAWQYSKEGRPCAPSSCMCIAIRSPSDYARFLCDLTLFYGYFGPVSRCLYYCTG